MLSFRNIGWEKPGEKTVPEAKKRIKELGFESADVESRDAAAGFYEKPGYSAGDGQVLREGLFDCIRIEERL